MPHTAAMDKGLIRALIVGGVLFSPLIALLWATGAALAGGHLDWLALALPTGRRLSLLVRSLTLSASVAVIDMGLGVLIVCASWRWRWAWLRWLPLVLITLPPYIHALVWGQALHLIGIRLSGPWISGWVLAMALLPVGVGLALVSLETVARSLVDAARVQQPDIAVLRWVVIPLAWPLLAVGGGVIFLLSLMDYSVPSLFGVNVYALEIFAEFSASYQPARALLLSAPLLALAVGALYAGQALVRHAAQPPTWRRSPWDSPPRWPGLFTLTQQIALMVWGAQILLPLTVLVGLTVRSDDGLTALWASAQEFGISFGVAVAAALLSLALSGLALGLFTACRPRLALIGWLCCVPAALPAPLVGIGLITLWNRPGMGALYPSLWMPVLAGLTRFAPFAILALLAQHRRIAPMIWDAARILQSRTWQTLWQVQIPLWLPGLLTGFCLVFALTLGELGATLLVAPPGQGTLTLRIYNYLHYGASDTVAGLCLAIVLASLIAGGIGLLGMAQGARHARGAGR